MDMTDLVHVAEVRCKTCFIHGDIHQIKLSCSAGMQ